MIGTCFIKRFKIILLLRYGIYVSLYRAVARSENPGGHIVLGGDNLPPLVEIGLSDLPKTGGARAPPAPPLATALSGLTFVLAFV